MRSPGYHDDLVVQTTTMTLARWHTRKVEWADALRSGQIRVTGTRALARMLPTWNLRAIHRHNGAGIASACRRRLRRGIHLPPAAGGARLAPCGADRRDNPVRSSARY